MDKAIKELLLNIETVENDLPLFPKSGYQPFPISKDNFHSITTSNDSSGKIAFVDGGNQEILGSHNFSLSLVRIYSAIFEKNRKTKKKTFEAYVLVSTKPNKEGMEYNAKIFPNKNSVSMNDISFDIYDETLKTGSHKVKIEAISDTVRKFMEISAAKELCKEVSGGIIILDRNLEATVTGESEVLEKLYTEAKKHGVNICGISKTSSLLTSSGNLLPAVLSNISPKSSWYYYPVAKATSKNHKAEIYIVKLNQKSKYIFRLEIHNGVAFNIDKILSALAENSKDPVFLGYPYGLVDADKFARVQNTEIDILRTQVFVKLGKDFEKIRAYLNTKNAHSVLDNIG